jgi:hypothetical protein
MTSVLTIVHFEPAIKLFITVLIDAVYPFLFAGYFIGSAFIFQQSGRNPLAAFIPIYNWSIMLKMGGNSNYWILGFIFPIINLYAFYKIHASIATAFNKNILWQFATGVFPMIFIPLLAFTDETYHGKKW